MKDLILKLKDSLKTFEKKGNTYQQAGVSPSRDWWFMLVLACVAVLASGVYSYYLYMKINSGQFVEIVSVENSSETRLNAVLLDRVSAELDSRTKDFEKIKNGVVIQDPSI